MQMDGRIPRSEIPEEVFLKKKTELETFYKQQDPVQCPYLKDRIHFNASGLEHIKFKDTKGRPRNRFDQYIRCKLFYLVPEILKKSHTLQGIFPTREWERQKKYGKWEHILVDIEYYEFVAVIGKMRIKVIVKKIGKEGNYTFWSVIPFWKMKEVTKEKIMHDGDPSED